MGFASAGWLFYFCDNILFQLKRVGKQVSCDNYFSRVFSVCFLLVLPVFQPHVSVLATLSSRKLYIKILYILFFMSISFKLLLLSTACLLIDLIYNYILLLRERMCH